MQLKNIISVLFLLACANGYGAVKAPDGFQIINMSGYQHLGDGESSFHTGITHVKPGEEIYMREVDRGKVIWIRAYVQSPSLTLGGPIRIYEERRVEVPYDKNAPQDVPPGGLTHHYGEEPNNPTTTIADKPDSSVPPEVQKPDQPSAEDQALASAESSATIYAASQIIYRTFIMDSSERRKLQGYQDEIKKNIQEAEKNSKLSKEQIIAGYNEMADAFKKGANLDPQFVGAGEFLINTQNDTYKFQSPNGPFRRDLKEIRDALHSVQTFDPKRKEAKEIGLEMTETADEAYANGHHEEAEFWKEAAGGIADIAFGWDPVTGFVRGVYEAATGKNLFTQKPLSTFERSLSALEVISFGLSGDVVKPIQIVAKLVGFSHRADEVIKVVSDTKKILGSKLMTEKGFDQGAKALRWITNKYPNLAGNTAVTHQLWDIADKIKGILEDVNHNNEIHFGHKFAYLPPVSQLDASTVSQFDDGAKGLRPITFNRGDVVYQTQVHGQPGTVFAYMKPGSADYMDQLQEELEKNPNIDSVKVYVIKEPVAAYVGMTDGGTGVKYIIPFKSDYLDILKEVKSFDFTK